MKIKTSTKTIKIKSRDQLLDTLAEASELEHNLMCMYLFAYFSLKNENSKDLSLEELLAIKKWGKVIRGIAIQEMGHLAMVANLTTAIGGTPNFFRPTFPVRPGNYPSEFVMELSPFSSSLLEHFIFLERPHDSNIVTSKEFTPDQNYTRFSPSNMLMSHTGEYETVGDLYDAISNGFEYLNEHLGEGELFCGSAELQLDQADMKMEGLFQIKNLTSAKAAIAIIVEQGEGSNSEDCHFKSFIRIKEELDTLNQSNPSFNPSRNCVKNPVMRNPVEHESKKTWIKNSLSLDFLDVGNALYGLMLRLLVQLYSMENRSRTEREFFLHSAFKMMNSLSIIGKILPDLPSEDKNSQTAGLNFSLNRNLSAYELSSEKRMIKERIFDINSKIKLLMEKSEFSEQLKIVEKNLLEIYNFQTN